MIPNSICFSYISLMREGMEWRAVPYPEPLISDILPGETRQVIVTAGIVFAGYDKSATIQVDILYNGESVAHESIDKDGSIDTPLYRKGSQGEISIVSTMRMKVAFPGPGEYVIKTSIIAGERDTPEGEIVKGPIADSNESRFYVSDWGNK